MKKIKLALPFLILSTLTLGELSFYQQAASAQTAKTPSDKSWSELFEIALSKKPPIRAKKGGSRGPSSPISKPDDKQSINKKLCLISPDAAEKRFVWSTKPTFIWQGNMNEITLNPLGDSSHLWVESAKNINFLNYTGQPLQPGKTYEWSLNNNNVGDKKQANSLALHIIFTIMDNSQRIIITKDLKKIESQLKIQQASVEKIAKTKADYFINKNLWTDALQQMYSVSNPSQELVKVREDIAQNLCKS
jgi:hypothetical protein